jgi:hypothetical protein
MRSFKQAAIEPARPIRHQARLDLVVPFTTPRLTMSALRAASRLGAELNADIRLIRVQAVPFPLDLDHPPVPADFLRAQLERIAAELPAACEIRLAREFEAGLRGALREHSLIILATRRRPWRTRTERLATKLRRDGYTVVLVPEETNNA